MKTESNLIVPALIIVAIYCMHGESAAPLVSDIGLPRQDLSLLEQRHEIPRKITFPSNGPSAGFYFFDPLSVNIDITEAMVAIKRQVVKISNASQRPVRC